MFRKEASTANREKFYGEVFLAQPVSFYALTLLITIIVFACIFFLLTGSYARSENVAGHLVPSTGLVKIQSVRFGQLGSIEVKEGDEVSRGQKLAVILVSNRTRDGNSLTDKVMAVLNSQEVELQTQIVLEENLTETEKARLIAQKREVSLKIRSLQAQLELRQQLSKSAYSSLTGVRDLMLKGFVSRDETTRRNQAWLQKKMEQEITEQELTGAESTLEQLDFRLLELESQSRQRVARLVSQQSELEGRKAELSGRSAYAITSPVEGKVVSINVKSVGYSVQEGQPLITILPRDSVLNAELFVPSRAIGFVRKGLEVRLLYDAFPYRVFGSYRGTVSSVTETILTPGEVLAPVQLQEPVYKVNTIIDQGFVQANGKLIALQIGMTLRANIVLERQGFIQWLLSPLYAVQQRT